MTAGWPSVRDAAMLGARSLNGARSGQWSAQTFIEVMVREAGSGGTKPSSIEMTAKNLSTPVARRAQVPNRITSP
jgi:hypothetical protein